MDHDEPRKRENATQSDYAVVLPCEPKAFGDFIAGLLGRPQTIGRNFTGVFDLTKEDIENGCHLLDQRVRQQNEASLVQFTVRILYDDDSSVLLDSFADFQHYRETRPITSVAANLTWIYLIKFRDRAFPEKQEINLTFSTDLNHRVVFVGHQFSQILHSGGFRTSGDVSLTIRHTARTWGVDVESLLTNHVQGLLKKEPKLKKLISENAGAIGLTLGAAVMVLAFAGAYVAQGLYLDRQLAAARAVASSAASAPADFIRRLDFVIDRLVAGQWGHRSLLVGAYLTGSFVLSLTLGIWVGTVAENRPSSFLVLSKRAGERRLEVLAKRNRRWYHLVAAFVVSILAGVVSNVLFAWFSSQYGQ